MDSCLRSVSIESCSGFLTVAKIKHKPAQITENSGSAQYPNNFPRRNL